MSIDTIKFPIEQPRMFNELITTANHFIVVGSSQTLTRSLAKTAHGCGHTQFIYICSCILGIDVDFSGKTQQEIDDLMNSYSIKINQVYQLLNTLNTDRNANSLSNNAVYPEILTKIDSIDDERITINDVYNYGDWDIMPLCTFSNSQEQYDNLKYISHYFTLIIDNKNQLYYINSSYGADNICVLNTTKSIDKTYFNDIISRINGGNFDSICDDFIKKYFLHDISEELFQQELKRLRISYIGLINNYVSNITSVVLNNPELRQENLPMKRRRMRRGGKKIKKTKQTKKYKIKNTKQKKYKIKHHKTKKNYKMKHHKTKNYKIK